MPDVENLSLEFACGETGARRLAGVLNRLLVDIGLVDLVDEQARRDPAKWADAFIAALDRKGCTAVEALAALALARDNRDAAHLALVNLVRKRRA